MLPAVLDNVRSAKAQHLTLKLASWIVKLNWKSHIPVFRTAQIMLMLLIVVQSFAFLNKNVLSFFQATNNSVQIPVNLTNFIL